MFQKPGFTGPHFPCSRAHLGLDILLSLLGNNPTSFENARAGCAILVYNSVKLQRINVVRGGPGLGS
jgi:hypothetical protein